MVRVFQGTQTEEEMRLFTQWYRVSQENKELFFRLKEVYQLSARVGKPAGEMLETSWKRLVAKLDHVSDSPSSLPSLESNRSHFGVFFHRYAGVAVILILLMVTGIFLLSKNNQPAQWVEIRTGALSKPEIVRLSDGTTVLLNASSCLRYPEKFDAKSREVFLDGEAYFDVAKHERKSFIVHVGNQQVNVLGTEFNILGYASYPYVITTLVNGRVRLGIYDDKNSLMNEVTMHPNQQLYFDKQTNQTVLSTANIADATSWIDGVYSFRDVELEDIARRLEKIYSIKIVIQDSIAAKERYTGKFFSDQTMRETINVLNFKKQFIIQHRGDTVILQ